MVRFLNTDKIDKETWLRARKKGITGTDAGAIAGMNPYKSSFSVYQEKVSEEVTEVEDNERMREGRDLEAYVAQRFTEATGLKTRRALAVFQNEKHPVLLADYDRLIVGQRAGLECKTVSPYAAGQWANEKIPMHYLMQVQHYLAVSGYDCWYLAALIFGQELIIHKIPRDEELIQSLITIEERFWKENVEKKIPPEPDGSDDYTKMLERKYHGDREKEIQLFGFDSKLRRRDEIDELMERLTTEKTKIDQEIKSWMGEASYAKTDGYWISWTESVQNRIDTKMLKQAEPQTYERYLKQVNSRRFSVKRTAA